MYVPREPIEAVSQRLNNFLSAARLDAEPLGDLAEAFATLTAETVSGGKQLRARFCVEGWRSIVGDVPPTDTVIDVAAALEIFHAAALVHDDLIDNSDTRRGRPATHRAVEAWHRNALWRGDADTFGRSAAILSGDLLVAWSDDLLEEGLRTATPEAAAETRRAYAHMRREVTIGQFMDVAEEHAYVAIPDADHVSRALRIASYKSARYSVQQPLVIGAAVGGAAPDQIAALSSFGHPVGMAFQLRDDVLGVFGDESLTGKPAGDDLREGKRTALIALMRDALSSDERDAVDRMLGDPAMTDHEVARLQETIRSTGALARVEGMIVDYVTESDAALAHAPLDAESLQRLRALTRASTTRVA